MGAASQGNSIPVKATQGNSIPVKATQGNSIPVYNEAAASACISRVKTKLKGNKDAQGELFRLFNESLNTSRSLRDSGLSTLQLAKVLSKFDPPTSEFSLRDKQKLAAKMITSKDQRIDYKTFMSLYSK